MRSILYLSGFTVVALLASLALADHMELVSHPDPERSARYGVPGMVTYTWEMVPDDSKEQEKDPECKSAKDALDKVITASAIGMAGPYTSKDVAKLDCASAKIAAELYAGWHPKSNGATENTQRTAAIETQREKELAGEIGNEWQGINSLLNEIVGASKAKSYGDWMAKIAGTIAKEINPEVKVTGLGIGGDEISQAMNNFKANLGGAFNPIPGFIHDQIGGQIASLLQSAQGKDTSNISLIPSPTSVGSWCTVNVWGECDGQKVDVTLANGTKSEYDLVAQRESKSQFTGVEIRNGSGNSQVARAIGQAIAEEKRSAADYAEEKAAEQKSTVGGGGEMILVTPQEHRQGFKRTLHLDVTRPVGSGFWFWAWSSQTSDWQLARVNLASRKLAGPDEEKQYDGGAKPPDSTKPKATGIQVAEALFQDVMMSKSRAMEVKLEQLKKLRKLLQQVRDQIVKAN